MKKIELKFECNWKAQMHSIMLLLEQGDANGKKYAREELLTLAEKLDNYNELNHTFKVIDFKPNQSKYQKKINKNFEINDYGDDDFATPQKLKENELYNRK